jgi:hypothetical protein
MQLRVHVVVPKIPSRARLDQFAAPSTPGEAGGHHGLEKRTGLAVTAAISRRPKRVQKISRRSASATTATASCAGRPGRHALGTLCCVVDDAGAVVSALGPWRGVEVSSSWAHLPP